MAASRSYCTVLALRVAPMSLQKLLTISGVYPLLLKPWKDTMGAWVSGRGVGEYGAVRMVFVLASA